MTLEQLRIFVAVAERLNMREASEVLHLTQPAVSAAIAALEARHDTRLFDRVGRGLELNAAGKVFLPEAQAVLARAEDARRSLTDLAGLERGELRIAASQTVATYWLPPRMARFVSRFPAIETSMSVGNTAQALDALLEGASDLAVVEGTSEHDLLRIETVGGDRLGIYAAPDHPLARQPIDSAALRSTEWVAREMGSGTRENLAAGLAGMGIALSDLTIRLTLPSNGAVLEAVAAGHLLGAVSELAAAPRTAIGSIVRLDCTLPARLFSLVQHRSRRPSRAVVAFLEMLESG